MNTWGRALLTSLAACALLIPVGVILMVVMTSAVALAQQIL